MDAVTYGRVATGEGAALRLLRFRTLCRKYAADKGLNVVADFEDIASGETLDRKGLTDMRELIATETIRVVIVYTFSQLTRSSWHRVSLPREFTAHNARIHVVREQLIV